MSEQAKKTVLLVEDDTAVRMVNSRILAKLGCDVVQAATVEEAQAQLDAVRGDQREIFDVWMTDNDLVGRETADGERMVKAQSLLEGGLAAVAKKVAVISGHATSELPDDVAFLLKPVAPEAMQDLLDESE